MEKDKKIKKLGFTESFAIYIPVVIIKYKAKVDVK